MLTRVILGSIEATSTASVTLSLPVCSILEEFMRYTDNSVVETRSIQIIVKVSSACATIHGYTRRPCLRRKTVDTAIVLLISGRAAKDQSIASTVESYGFRNSGY